LKGEGEHIRLICDKLWDDMPRLEGWGAREGPHLVALRCAGYTAAHLKSYGEEPGAPEVIRANREAPVKYLRGIKGCSSKKVTWLTAQLKYLYTNTCSMGNRQEELEATVLLESYDLVALAETSRDESHGELYAFLECIEYNFLSQVIDSPTQGVAVLDLLVTNTSELIGDIKIGGSVGCSDHTLVEFAVLKDTSQAKSSQDCVKRSMASRTREGILPLCSGETPPGVLHPPLQPSAQDRHGLVGAGPEETTQIIRGVEHLSCEERLSNLLLFSLEKRRLQGDLSADFQYFKEAYRKDGDRHFSRSCCDRIKSNGFKLKEGRTRLDIKKKFFTMRVLKHWHRLPREVVEAPSLEMFKVRLDGALSNLI